MVQTQRVRCRLAWPHCSAQVINLHHKWWPTFWAISQNIWPFTVCCRVLTSSGAFPGCTLRKGILDCEGWGVGWQDCVAGRSCPCSSLLMRLISCSMRDHLDGHANRALQHMESVGSHAQHCSVPEARQLQNKGDAPPRSAALCARSQAGAEHRNGSSLACGLERQKLMSSVARRSRQGESSTPCPSPPSKMQYLLAAGQASTQPVGLSGTGPWVTSNS